MKLIQAADPSAATPLHDRFAAGLRVLLRRKIPHDELELGVFYVLVTVARAIREGRIQDDEDLLAEVRTTANSFIEEATAPHAAGASRAIEKIRRGIRHLSPKDQEILTRLYHLEQTAEEISRQMQVTTEAVRVVKENARQRYLAKK